MGVANLPGLFANVEKKKEPAASIVRTVTIFEFAEYEIIKRRPDCYEKEKSPNLFKEKIYWYHGHRDGWHRNDPFPNFM